MPNKNYIKGRRKEYKICNELREQGYDIVQRTAGSHSPIDIIAIRKATKDIFFVQCKPESMSMNEIKMIEEQQIGLNDEYKCKFKVI